MIQMSVVPHEGEYENGLSVLSSLPVSFFGLAFFRAWMWSVADTAGSSIAVEQVHDCVLCAALLALAFLARRLVPLGLNRIALALCISCALAGSSLLLLAGHTVLPLQMAYVAIALIAVASALLILSWCELYTCLDIARIALCLAVTFLVEQGLIGLLGNSDNALRAVALLAFPLVSVALLRRAYGYLPETMRPKPIVGKLRVPWRLIALLAAYFLVSGTCMGFAGDSHSGYSGMASLIVSAFLLVAILFHSEKFDLTVVSRTPVFLMVSVLLLLPALGSASSGFFSFCVAVGLRLFEIVVFLLLSDISRRHAIMAVSLFGIEEATALFRSIGYGIGSIAHSSSLFETTETVAMLIGIALLIGATLLLFNDRQFETTWGSSLLGPGKIRWNQEQREALASACDRLTEEYGLTTREREVLELLGEGKSLSQVCTELCIAKGTAKAHTDHIYSKVGVHTRRQLLDLLGRE